MQKQYKRLIGDTALFTISNFASRVLSFLLVPLYTMYLSEQDYGISDLIQNTVNLLYPILTLSVLEATLRFSLDHTKNNKEVLSISLGVVLLSSIILFLSMGIVVRVTPEVKEYSAILIIFYILFCVHYCFSQYIRGIEKIKLFAVQGIVQTIVFLVSNIITLVYLKMGLDGYFISLFSGYLSAILFMLIGGIQIKNISVIPKDRKLFKEMLKYSLPLIPTQLAWWINSMSDRYIIIAKIGLAENGIYSVAQKIPTILTVFTTIFVQAWQISAISAYEKNDGKSKFYTNVYNMYLFISITGCSGLIMFAELLGRLLFSKGFYVGWKLVPILLLAFVFSGISGFLASIFNASKRTNILFISTAAGAVINIILNLILIDFMGAAGAAVATAVSFLVVWIIRFQMSQKIVKMEICFWKNILEVAIISIQAMMTIFYNQFAYFIGIISLLLILLLNHSIVMMIINYSIKFIKKHRSR